jgi:hypothetical protein
MTKNRNLILAAALIATVAGLAVIPSHAPDAQAADSAMTHQQYVATAYVAQVAAATATEKHPIFVAPRGCKVTEVSVIPQTATTGDNTNTKNLNVLDADSDGTGTTEIANKDLATGTNLVALDETVITLNASNTAGRALVAGEVLALQVEKVGTGVIVGPFVVKVLWQPN